MATSLAKEFLLQSRNGEEQHSLSRIVGGGNNQAYRFEANNTVYFVKHYFAHPSDLRDRQGNELRFFELLKDFSITTVPKVIDVDKESRVTVFDFIDGTKLLPHEISNTHLDQLANFFKAINTARNTTKAEALQVASESFFSLSEHLRCVANRVDRFRRIEGTSTPYRRASELIDGHLIPLWDEIRSEIEKDLPALESHWTELQTVSSARCISPSDFGFHNALQTVRGELIFFDFEYSGWDDVAKTICDLYWQVASPITSTQCHYFFDLIRIQFQQTAFIENRIRVLLPVFGIKWCCIILNHFAAQDKIRKEFANDDSQNEEALNKQLDKAESILTRLSALAPHQVW